MVSDKARDELGRPDDTASLHAADDVDHQDVNQTIKGRETARESRRRSEDDILVAALGERLTEEEAAARAGVSSRTVRRRLREEAFARRVAEARDKGVQRALRELDVGLPEAISTARHLVQPDNPPSVRLRAAQVLLSAAKLREVDVEKRLFELERALERSQDRDTEWHLPGHQAPSAEKD